MPALMCLKDLFLMLHPVSRKHLPYYNEHISDQKLESYVEMMERLDTVVVDSVQADTSQNAKMVNVDKDESGAPPPSIAHQQAIGQSSSAAARHLGPFIPIPVPQAQGQAPNVQVCIVKYMFEINLGAHLTAMEPFGHLIISHADFGF